MRKLAKTLLIAALMTAPCAFARAQDPAQSGAAAQPPSVAEAARLARAKKQGDAVPTPKPAKIMLDDDNMPRGVYAADIPSKPENAEAKATPGAPAGGGGAFPEYRGKVVLLDFWASWCGPCRRALPNLKRLQAAYGGADLVVVSISEDESEDDWKAFTATQQMTWPQRFDNNSALQRQFGVKALPTYVLLGRDGEVVQKFVGEDPARSIMERIGPELKQTLTAER